MCTVVSLCRKPAKEPHESYRDFQYFELCILIIFHVNAGGLKCRIPLRALYNIFLVAVVHLKCACNLFPIVATGNEEHLVFRNSSEYNPVSLTIGTFIEV